MPLAGFEPANLANARLQTLALDGSGAEVDMCLRARVSTVGERGNRWEDVRVIGPFEN